MIALNMSLLASDNIYYIFLNLFSCVKKIALIFIKNDSVCL